jgi:glucokinase
MTNLYPALVADIGGTNARFAMIDEPGMTLRDIIHLKTADYPGLYEAMSAYGERTGEKPRAACVAVAGPVMSDNISFTNQHVAFSIAETRRKTGIPLDVINDCAAFAYALPHLPAEELIYLGGGEASPSHAKVVVCPGTGLGASALVPAGRDWAAVPGETGHVDLPVVEELEIEVLRAVRKERGRASVESILSGPGLLLLRNALANVLSLDAPPIEAADLTRLGTAPGDAADPLCKQTLETFCALLGGVAGNMALTFGALGGVYLGGGIPPRFPDFIKASAFRRRFEAKGRMSELLKRIPTLLITGHNVALRGSAIHLQALSQRG